MKLHLIFTITMLTLTMHSFGQSNINVADKLSGIYWSPKRDAKIEIYQQSGKYFGKSIWIAEPKKDVKNPHELLRSRNLLGIELLSGFSYDDGRYSDGKIYDPESGKTYDCTMTLNGNQLQVRGYIGISLFGRTEIFERIR
ncbi:MAG: DUF2147 domain-containing protein [Bacteroidota bacterium]